MKRILFIVAAVLTTAACFAQESSKPSYFIRPLAYFVSPTNEGYSDAGAVGLSCGASFGAKDEHELSAEWAYTYWDAYANSTSVSVWGREHYLPIMFNYRFRMGSQASIVRVYFGPSIGITRTWVDVSARSGSSTYSASSGDWTFNASGSVGLLIKLATKIEADLGYRYLHTEGGTYSIAGSSFKGEAGKAHMLYAGLNCRF